MGSTIRAALLLTFLTFSPPQVRAQELWTVGAAGGVADRYTYRTLSFQDFDYDERFSATWIADLAAAHRLGRHFWLQCDAGYLGYNQTQSLASTETPAGTTHLSASYPNIGVGARYYPILPVAASRARAYLQFVPTLYASTWKERNEYPGYSLSGTYYPAHETEDTFTSVLPGFVAGAGVTGLNQTSLRVDIGFRFYYSANPGHKDLGEFSTGEFKGLRQLAVLIGVHKPV